MVSVIWATVAFMLGILCYILPPFLTLSMPVTARQRVGDFYHKQAARLLKQYAFVRRVLSGYDIYPITVDDEQKLLKVTLSNSITGDDNEYPFKDPDNNIKRLFGKPVALNYEEVPAAVDAELAEYGHHVNETHTNTGFITGDPDDDPDDVTVNPHVRIPRETRLVDPVDAYNLVPNDVSPENVKTTEELTKKRFEKYGLGPGAREAFVGLVGFFSGFGAVMLAWYMQTEVMDSSGGGGGVGGGPELPVGMIADLAAMVVTAV